MSEYLEEELLTDLARRLDDKHEREALRHMQSLKSLYSLRTELQNFQLEEKLSSFQLKQSFAEKLKTLGSMIINFEGLFNTLDSRNYFNNQTILSLLRAASTVDQSHSEYQRFEDILNNLKIHTNELNDFISANELILMRKTKRFINERITIQQEFIKILTMVSACNRKILQLREGLAGTDITLFDNIFLNNILAVTQVFQEVTTIINLVRNLDLDYQSGEEVGTLVIFLNNTKF